MNKLIILGDSPTVHTGFANVIRNLARTFHKFFDEVHIWGINYNGWPHEYPYKIYPAGYEDWPTGRKLSQFLNLINASDFTHLFILMDTHGVTGEFAKHLRNVLKQKKVHFTFYFPVDAAQDKGWLDGVSIANVSVCYTRYGLREIRKVRPDLNPIVLPHGVDTNIYRPLPNRLEFRQKMFAGWVKPNDFLFVNVNRNERRKCPQHSLQILKGLTDRGLPVKLYMHMPQVSLGEATDLNIVGQQLGLEENKHWSHGDKFFVNNNGLASEEGMNEMYNAADFCLTTSSGEGWGLSTSESLAAGCQVIAPNHTSLAEIGQTVQDHADKDRFTLLPVSKVALTNMLDSSRVRYPVDVEASVNQIAALLEKPKLPRFDIASTPLRELWSWERIGSEFTKLMVK